MHCQRQSVTHAGEESWKRMRRHCAHCVLQLRKQVLLIMLCPDCFSVVRPYVQWPSTWRNFQWSRFKISMSNAYLCVNLWFRQ